MWVWERVRRDILLCFYEKTSSIYVKAAARRRRRKRLSRVWAAFVGQNDGVTRSKKKKRKKRDKLMHDGIYLAAKHDQKERISCSEEEKKKETG